MSVGLLNCSRNRRDICENYFCSCDQRCSRADFFPLYVSIWQTRVCDISSEHLQGSKTRHRQDICAEPQPVSAVVTWALSGLSVFYSLVSIWQPWVWAIRDAHLLSLTDRIQTDNRSDYFCSCKPRCCRSECVLLLGLNVQSDIFAIVIAWR